MELNTSQMHFKSVLSAELCLPFCLRLPAKGFFVWDPDPKCSKAVILPSPRLGEVSFSKTTTLVSSDRLLWESAPLSPIPTQKMRMTCMVSGGEIPTLEITAGPQGGFRQLRAYTDVLLLTVLGPDQDPFSGATQSRVFATLNHFLDVYRAITQDPYVARLDPELDAYIVHYCTAELPPELTSKNDAVEILGNLESLSFSHVIGRGRNDTCRLNTLEDVYPGGLLEPQFLEKVVRAARSPYDLPLHYELIFTAQRELKLRNYHVAVLEAETAFEVFVAARLVDVAVALGTPKEEVRAEMEYPGKLHFLAKRLTGLDERISTYRQERGFSAVPNFVGSSEHTAWKSGAYEMRNRVIHEGWRTVKFDLAKAAIAASKQAIRSIEDRLPDFAEPIQICPSVEHLSNTAGRLQF